MVEKLARHERRYIENRTKGKRLKYAAPLDVYAYRIEVGEETFSVMNGKRVTLRKNGTYTSLSFTQSEKRVFKQ